MPITYIINPTKHQIKEWQLTINQQAVKLILTKQTGTCFKCSLPKEICLTSERPIRIGTTETHQERQFCWGCSLANLYELEQSDYQISNKKEIIKEIRIQLHHE